MGVILAIGDCNVDADVGELPVLLDCGISQSVVLGCNGVWRTCGLRDGVLDAVVLDILAMVVAEQGDTSFRRMLLA